MKKKLIKLLGKYIINPSEAMDASVEINQLISEFLEKEKLKKRIKFETSEGMNNLVKDLNLQDKKDELKVKDSLSILLNIQRKNIIDIMEVTNQKSNGVIYNMLEANLEELCSLTEAHTQDLKTQL